MKHMYRALLALLVTFVSLGVKGQVSGPTGVCVGSTITLAGTPAGGLWSTVTTGIATVGTATGIVTGISPGAAVITYTAPGPVTYTYGVTVNPVPGSVTGTASICVGSSSALSSTTTGGTWSSTNAAVAIVGSSSGVVTGTAAGTATISYIMSYGCYTTRVVTVNPLPLAITGSTTVSCGGTTTLTDATPGGIWSSSVPAVATISGASGVVTAVSGGTTTITYSLATGCSRTVVVTVTGTPSPGTISGPSFVCVGSTITLSTTGSGGTWSTAGGHTTISSGGVVTGVSAGLDSAFYTVTGTCGTLSASYGVLVGTTPTMGSITGSLGLCEGATSTLSCTPAGGTWTSSTPSIATVGATTGIATGGIAGTTIISYTMSSSCGTGVSTAVVTVNAAPGAITGGGGFVCVGTSITLSNSVSGGTWSSSFSSVSVGASTGVVTGVSFGVASISYIMPGGCMATTAVTVSPATSVSASATPASCGPMYTGTATGASTYTWSPATGVTCSTCATTNIDVTSSTTFTVTGTTGACASTTTVTINGNRIDGHIFFSSTAPSTPDCKVWLIQFNPTDSTITGVDSINTCMDGSAPYYEFASKPSGSYMVKAKLLSSVAGTSGYIPTYGSSTPNWYLAASITHTSATDVQNIMMAYGTVPSGPGFIAGYVVSGAGKGTSGDAPVPGMIIYLKNASTGDIITYTYTDATGAYSFSGLAYGTYIVHPEEFDYYTTPSSVITLNASTPGASATNFKEYTTSHVIKPYTIPNGIAAYTTAASELRIYPNPANGYVTINWGVTTETTGKVVMKDITGREIRNMIVNIDAKTAESTVDVSNIAAGIYFITVNNHTEKLIIK